MLVNTKEKNNKKETQYQILLSSEGQESQELKKNNNNKKKKKRGSSLSKQGQLDTLNFSTTPDMSIKDNTVQEYLSDTPSCIHKQPVSFKVNEETELTSPHWKVIEM